MSVVFAIVCDECEAVYRIRHEFFTNTSIGLSTLRSKMVVVQGSFDRESLIYAAKIEGWTFSEKDRCPKCSETHDLIHG